MELESMGLLLKIRESRGQPVYTVPDNKYSELLMKVRDIPKNRLMESIEKEEQEEMD